LRSWEKSGLTQDPFAAENIEMSQVGPGAMAKENQATLKIEWIRSGIAFNRKQKEIVRSLGLRRLHHVVERPDNPVVRGLIAKVSHLVEVREETRPPAWASVPEYTILGPPAATEPASHEKEGLQPLAEAAAEATPHATAEPAIEPETAEALAVSEPEEETSGLEERTRT
jgi:large subunit ribosomal protein L30